MEQVPINKIISDDTARLNAVLETVIDGLIIIDAKGRIATFNSSAERLFGYSREEVIGKNVSMLMPDPYQSEHDQYLTNYLTTGDNKVIGIGREIRARRKNGEVFDAELGVNEMQVSGQRMFVGTIRNISKRKDDAAQFKAVLDTVIDGLIIIDAQGHISTFNSSAERLFGYAREEVIGKNVSMLMPEPYRGEHDQYLVNYLTTAENKVIGIGREITAQRKDGEVFDAELGVNELEVSGVRMFVGTIRDISDRKRAENELLRSNEELERFAYVTSHDLQEPLRTVVNFSELLSLEARDKLDGECLQFLNIIAESAGRMQRQILDLLEYSRLTSIDSRLLPCDTEQQTKIAMANLEKSIDASDAKITLGHMPTVMASDTLFTSMMQNLIGNAIKYRHADRTPIISISAQDCGEDWKFCICDNGIGIQKEYCDQIFDIFRRLHKREEYSGTGIGLAICRKIVDSFNGRIWVESTPGEGSNFYFTVPKSEETT